MYCWRLVPDIRSRRTGDVEWTRELRDRVTEMDCLVGHFWSVGLEVLNRLLMLAVQLLDQSSVDCNRADECICSSDQLDCCS